MMPVHLGQERGYQNDKQKTITCTPPPPRAIPLNKPLFLLTAITIISLIFTFTGCPEVDDGGGGGGGSGGGGGGGGAPPTFTSIAAFKTWLEAQPNNSPRTAYNVKVNVSDLGGNRYTTGSLGDALWNIRRYLNLDLSGSTFTSIGYRDLDNCNLTNVTIPNSVTSIGVRTFTDSQFLVSVTVDNANTAYSSQDGVLYNKDKTFLHTYPSGKTDVSFTIPNSVTSIEEWTFSSCTSLADVTIPNGVTSIGSHAFWDTGITSITIPNSVTSIGEEAFSNCISLTSVTVGNANTAYSSQDGVLYNKEKTLLHTYPSGKTDVSFTIPNSVTSIGNDAFFECTSLTSVTIGNGVTSIGRGAFIICRNLTSVIIPNSVTSIGNQAFDYCTSLTSVTFTTGSNISDTNFGDSAFPEENGGDRNTLKTAYSTGKAGTYTRAENGDTWTKQQ